MLILSLIACIPRTYLSDEEKNWLPYNEGDILIFKSSSQKIDSILIEEIRDDFPDYLGSDDFYQIRSVIANHHHFKDPRKVSTYLIKLVAYTEDRGSYIEFGIETRNAQFIEKQQFSFTSIQEQPVVELTVPYGSFNDVLLIGNKSDYSSTQTAIDVIYWSRSHGYLRFDKYDGTSWELIDMVEKKP